MRVLLTSLGIAIAGTAITNSGLPGAAALGGLLGGVAGNLATDFYKIAERQVADRILDRWNIHENNYCVYRELRLAQLEAAQLVLIDFDKSRDRAAPDNIVLFEDDFVERTRIYLDTQINEANGRTPLIKMKDSRLDRIARSSLLEQLPVIFSKGLVDSGAIGKIEARPVSFARI